MKKTAYILALALTMGSFALHAQTDTSAQTTQTTYTYVTAKEDLTAKFLPMPDPLTMEMIFPATGNFQLTQSNIEGATEINIMLDSVNKGLVWIEGLPLGRIKAQLRQSPATYKIPAQKTEDGKSIEEGTLVYDKEANVLNICLGCTYDETEPAKPFAIATETTVDSTATVKTTKNTKKTNTSKKKVWNYTGAKVIVEEEAVIEGTEAPKQMENKEMKQEEKEEQKEEIEQK